MEGLIKWLVVQLAGPVGRQVALVLVTELVSALARHGVIAPEQEASVRDVLAPPTGGTGPFGSS